MNFLISSPVLKAAAHTSEPFLDEFYNYLLVQESALSWTAAFFATSGVVFFQRPIGQCLKSAPQEDFFYVAMLRYVNCFPS